MNQIRLIQIITFLSAFLLFQIELLIGKLFLPNFGGSYMVWGACVVFFQAIFLLGYKYSQVVVEKVGIARYRRMHCLLAFLPLLSFPGQALPVIFESAPLPMMLAVFWQLCLLIGPVFFILTTTSVIWQVWLSSSHLPERKNPYALFAVSNLGSFIALISYPFVFELYFDLMVQQNIWRICYLIFIGLQWWAFALIDVRPVKERTAVLKPASLKRKMMWGCYAAAGVMIFLAVTNIMTSEIAPIPLLWVLPLLIYLISFIFNFKKKPYCPKWVKSDFHFLAGLGVVSYFIVQSPILPMALNILLLCLMTYYVCMHTQYKLFQLKPGDHRHLPNYYFIISLGSFLGGVLVTWVMPLLSSTFTEYFAAFFVIAVAFLFEKKEKHKPHLYIWVAVVFALLYFWPEVFSKIDLRFGPVQFIGLVALIVTIGLIFSCFKNNAISFLLCFVLCISFAQKIESSWSRTNVLYQKRNYYGISRIILDGAVRSFLHGRTIHGAQYRDPAKQHIPISYYGYESPIGQLLASNHFDFKDVGIIGLGTGTLGAYFKDDWQVDYFELEQDVYDMAVNYFSYIKKAKGSSTYAIGDGRILMNRKEDARYDLVVVDAFSGDSIPIHLMTKEALQIYKRVVQKDGLVVFHISNRFIDIGVPLVRTAQFLGAKACFKEGEAKEGFLAHSTWVAFSWKDAPLLSLIKKEGWEPVRILDPQMRVWTDTYSNILPFVYADEFWHDLRFFFYHTFGNKKKS